MVLKTKRSSKKAAFFHSPFKHMEIYSIKAKNEPSSYVFVFIQIFILSAAFTMSQAQF